MMIRALALALTIAFAGFISTHAANGSHFRRAMSDAIGDAKHERLQKLALKMTDSSRASRHSNNVDLGAGVFEQEVHSATASIHSAPAKLEATKALQTHNHHNKGGVDAHAIEHLLGKSSNELQDTAKNGEGGDYRKLQTQDQTLDQVCDIGENVAISRANELSFYAEEPEQCECGESTNGKNYLSICKQENSICLDFSSRTTDAFVQISHIFLVPKSGTTPLLFQCVEYGRSDPRFPGQEVCTAVFTDVSDCGVLVDDELCDSCSLCDPGESSAAQISCAGTPGTSNWSTTSINQCTTAGFSSMLGTPFEWLHPNTSLCRSGGNGGGGGGNNGGNNDQEIVGQISEQCVDEFLALSERSAISRENEAIGRQRQALEAEDFCTNSGITRCELDYGQFSHDLQGACNSNNGIYFESDYTITCIDKSTNGQALTFTITNLPECAGGSCSSSGIGVISQVLLKTGFLDPLEESGRLDCTGFWDVERFSNSPPVRAPTPVAPAPTPVRAPTPAAPSPSTPSLPRDFGPTTDKNTFPTGPTPGGSTSGASVYFSALLTASAVAVVVAMFV